MAETIWIPGAERLTPSLAGGEITSTADPRTVWHTTEADPGTSQVWASMIRVLTSKSDEPQVLYDPYTDRLGQFIPLNLSGRALKNDGAAKTNRTGRACIQIEVIGRAAKPFTAYWKPGPNFRALMAAIRSWGIPDVWPSGPPPRFVQVGTGGYNSPEDERSRAIWTTKGGHYGHSQIPGNSHGDPGGINIAALFAAGKPIGAPGNTPTPPKENDVTPEQQAQLDRMEKNLNILLGESRAHDSQEDGRYQREEKWNREILAAALDDNQTPPAGTA